MSKIKGCSIQNEEPTPDNPAKIKSLELEEKYIVHLTDEEYRNLVDIIRKETKQEFEQKVKDLIENETINISGFKCIAVEDLEELLEDK